VLVFVFACMRSAGNARVWIGLLLIVGSLALFAGVILGPTLLKSLEKVAELHWLVLTAGRLPSSVMSRVHLVQNGWELYQRFPLGIGPGTCDLHNDYIAFLFERGPLGLIGWLWLVASGLLGSWRTARAQEDLFSRWQVLTFGAAFLSIMVNSLSHEVFHFRQVWMLMAFLFASCTLLTMRIQGVNVDEND
jgi:O-antigen ligase